MKKTIETIQEKSQQLLRRLSHHRSRVYNFHEAGHLLETGGVGLDSGHLSTKGATLCELTNMGFPVPHGFVLTTDNFTDYLECYEKTLGIEAELSIGAASEASAPLHDQLLHECTQQIHEIERKTGLVFGGVAPVTHEAGHNRPLPLLFAVRTGSSVFRPHAMNAVLNVGMTDAVVALIIESNPGYRRFALDTQRRFLSAYGTLVQQVRPMKYQRVLEAARRYNMFDANGTLSEDGLVYVVNEYRRITQVPSDPYTQLKEVIEALYDQSLLPRVVADLHSEQVLSRSGDVLDHTDSKGIAVIVQQMIYGNLNSRSGTGACFSRHPNSLPAAETKDIDAPASLILGEFLPKGEGGEMFGDKSEAHSPRHSMLQFKAAHPQLYAQLQGYLTALESKRRLPQYLEFTVEDGSLYVLDCSDVNLHAHVKDPRFVPYYKLLLDIQNEEEAEEESNA